MNKLNIFKLSQNLKRKIMKYDIASQKIITKDVVIQDFFKERRILLIYPFPSKERLNSELYDDVLRKLKIAKEIQEDEELNSKLYNQNPKLSIQERLESLEIYKTKYINELDDIVGLSELSENKTEEFLKNIRVPEVWFIIDESNQINLINKFVDRYEMLINNLIVEEYRADPTLGQNIFLSLVFTYLLVILILLSLNGFSFVLKNYKESQKVDKLIYSAIKF